MSGWPRLRSRLDWRGVLHPGPWVGVRAPLWGIGVVAAIVLMLHVLQLIEDRLGLPKQGPLTLVRLALAIALILGIYALRCGSVSGGMWMSWRHGGSGRNFLLVWPAAAACSAWSWACWCSAAGTM